MANVRTSHSLSPLLLATVLLSSACVAVPCLAQDAPAPASVQLKQFSRDTLLGFEPPAGQEYDLGNGDEITIEVLGHPDLSGKHTIGPDGRITLPVAGDLNLAGKTRAEAAKDIQVLLSAFYKDVSVSISVDHYVSNRILLLGAVEHPGLIAFDGPPTLLELVARGGIAQKPAQAETSAGSSLGFPSPMTMPELCMIYRGEKTVVTLQLRRLLQSGDPLANLRLKRGDIVFVPGDFAYVSIMGSVLHPGLARLEKTSTLPQLLAAAGGPNDKSGRSPQILVVHPGTAEAAGSIQTASFKDILQAKPIRIELRSGDVIYVDESGFNHFADVLQKISPLINLITVGALLR